MKIKNDFITNSSSCSFLVYIPNGEKLIEELEQVVNISEEMKDHLRHIHLREYTCFGEESYDEFHTLIKEMEKLDYKFYFLENGPENDPTFINLASKKIKKIMEIK